MFNFIFLSRFFTKMGCFCAHWTGNFLNFLSCFFTKLGSFCAHWKGNFLNFPKLSLVLSLVQFWCPLWPLNKDPPFFGTPCSCCFHHCCHCCCWANNVYVTITCFSFCSITMISPIYWSWIVTLSHSELFSRSTCCCTGRPGIPGSPRTINFYSCSRCCCSGCRRCCCSGCS